jgi:hypothetical protein
LLKAVDIRLNRELFIQFRDMPGFQIRSTVEKNQEHDHQGEHGAQQSVATEEQ